MQNPLKQKLKMLEKHLDADLQRSKIKQEFYRVKQQQLSHRKEYLQNKHNKVVPLMSQSLELSDFNKSITNFSILKGNQSVIKNSKECLREKDDGFLYQYDNVVDEIRKSVELLQRKEQPIKKNPSKITIKTQQSLQKDQSKVQSPSKIKEENLDRKRLMEFGKMPVLIQQDDIFNNLVNNLEKEEQKFIKIISQIKQNSTKSKLKVYVEKLRQKNQEKIFKVRQQLKQQTNIKTVTNKETVLSGYTIRMKNLIRSDIRTSF